MLVSLEEFFSVLEYSKRTYWAIIFGMFLFIGINILGDIAVSNIELSGYLKGLENTVIQILFDRYKELAWGTLFTFWFRAFKFYKKDKKRLESI